MLMALTAITARCMVPRVRAGGGSLPLFGFTRGKMSCDLSIESLTSLSQTLEVNSL